VSAIVAGKETNKNRFLKEKGLPFAEYLKSRHVPINIVDCIKRAVLRCFADAANESVFSK